MTTQSQRFRAARERLGIGVRKFAGMIHVSPSHVSQVESGKTRPSDLYTSAVAQKCEVSEQWLRDGEGPMEAASTLAPIISTDPELQTLQEALAAWWSHADEDERAYLRVVLRRNVPELKLK